MYFAHVDFVSWKHTINNLSTMWKSWGHPVSVIIHRVYTLYTVLHIALTGKQAQPLMNIVKPIIFAALNVWLSLLYYFGVHNFHVLLHKHYTNVTNQYSQPVSFVNAITSQNLQNEGHARNTGSAVLILELGRYCLCRYRSSPIFLSQKYQRYQYPSRQCSLAYSYIWRCWKSA